MCDKYFFVTSHCDEPPPTSSQIATFHQSPSPTRADVIHENANAKTNFVSLRCFSLISKDTLDRAFVAFRNASQDERLSIISRMNLLELIELRAKVRISYFMFKVIL